MAPREPIRPQLDFPQLTADLIRQLQLKGQVGLLDFIDSVQPTMIIGIRDGISFNFVTPSFTSAQVTSGEALSPAANTIVADTGPLPAGTYDLTAQINIVGNGAAQQYGALEHRNAANSATLATLLRQLTTTITNRSAPSAILPLMGYVIGASERLRVRSPNQLITGGVSGSIYLAIRPVP